MSVIRPTVTVGVQPGTKLLRIERVPGKWVDSVDGIMSQCDLQEWEDGAWLIWINSNIDFTLGTFIKLNDDGTIDRVTLNPDGSEDIFCIKSAKDK